VDPARPKVTVLGLLDTTHEGTGHVTPKTDYRGGGGAVKDERLCLEEALEWRAGDLPAADRCALAGDPRAAGAPAAAGAGGWPRHSRPTGPRGAGAAARAAPAMRQRAVAAPSPLPRGQAKRSASLSRTHYGTRATSFPQALGVSPPRR
jgi:hypothetical protein